MKNVIKVIGARAHNLKNISIEIPKGELTVITGLSGSGKSSLAFDTIYAEGQRRYVESLSSYARQFLGIMEKPDVDYIEGLSPAISIDQKTAARSPRSTVGTMSEIYDYLRLLFAKIGTIHCPLCGAIASTQRRQNHIKTKTGGKRLVSQNIHLCSKCAHEFPEITMSSFSFNSPAGACPTCQGLGVRLVIEPKLVFPNRKLTLAEGAIRPWSRITSHANWYAKALSAVASEHKISLNLSINELKSAEIAIILKGDKHLGGNFEGVIPNLERRYHATDSDYIRSEIEKYMVEQICEVCHGSRLRTEVLAITIGGQSIAKITQLTIADAQKFFANLSLDDQAIKIGNQILREINNRLSYLAQVGLSYLTLNRNADTLAGGEAQRIRLATQLGSALTGVLYILDEPSIGLHPRDHDNLIQTLIALRDLGNTVIVVEHDQITMEAADYLIDMGPGAGDHGGQVMAKGSPSQVKNDPNSITGRYLSGKSKIEIPKKRRKPGDNKIVVVGAKEFNLKNITVEFPLNLFICVTGVSGSGKSTLVSDILARALAQKFHHAKTEPGKHDKIIGMDHINKVIAIDQSPIGRTPRSNPATYTGLFTPIRELFASTAIAKELNLDEGHFSFNVKGGRCENCRGEGANKVEMHFLPDIYVSCEHCSGTRYDPAVLEVTYNHKNIADVLDMTAEEALSFFKATPAIADKLKVLADVGLGYMHLGQTATSLSGGEAQRVKLATELARHDTGKTLYILDEPTSGLHFEDIKRLLVVLQALVDKGNTILIIEHNLDVIKSCDWVIDLGPDGGNKGGQLVAAGTPEQVAKIKSSITGQYLAKALQRML